MDINNLEAFITVADKKSFSRSADSLQLTQSAVSKRIAALESVLSARLFDHIGRDLHLTEAGEVLLPKALKISSEMAKIESEFEHLCKDVDGVISIGAVGHAGFDRLVPLLKTYKKNYPGVELQFHLLDTDQALEDLENGVLDLVFNASVNSHSQSDRHSSFISIDVWNDKLQVVVENDHPLAQITNITVADLAKYPAIVPAQSSPVRQSLDKIIKTTGAELRVAMESPDFSCSKLITASGFGWALLPVAALDNGYSVVDVTDLQLSCSVKAVISADRTVTRPMRAFIESIHSFYSLPADSPLRTNKSFNKTMDLLA